VSPTRLSPVVPLALAPDRLEAACRRAVVAAALSGLDRPVASPAVAGAAARHVFGGAWSAWMAPCVASTLMVALAEAERRGNADPALRAALHGLVARAWATPPSSRARAYVLAVGLPLLWERAGREVA
jgi:hypothetical protein